MAIYHRRLLPVWVSFALMAQQANAIGMGDVQVHSHLGEPLQAEVLLNKQGATDEGRLVVAVGGQTDYEMLGIEFNYLHTQLIIEPFARNGQDYLRIRTREPVTEPFVEFVLNIRSPQGQVMREYTVLLDPPDIFAHNQQLAEITPGPAVEVVTASPSQSVTRAAASSHPNSVESIVASAPIELPVVSGAGYLVKQGDSLWSIADQLRSSSVTQSQAMAELVALNPHAFINGDPNRLRASVRLAIPVGYSSSKVATLAEEKSNRAESSSVMPTMEAPQQVDLMAENAALQRQLDELNDAVGELEQRLVTSSHELQELSFQIAVLEQGSSRQQASPRLAAEPVAVMSNVVDTDWGASLQLGLPSAQAATGEWEAVTENPWWERLIYWLGIAGAAGWLARKYLIGTRRVSIDAEVDDKGAPIAMPFEQAQLTAKACAKQPLCRAEPVVAKNHELASFNLPVSFEAEQELDVAAAGDNPEAAAVTAGLFVAFGRYDEAEELLCSALKRYPEQAELKLLLLNVYLQTHRHQSYKSLELQLLNSVLTEDEQTKFGALQESYKIHYGNE